MKKRIKSIKQTDPKDCGPVCMAMISNYYGYSVSVTRLREYGGTDLQGTNIAGLMKIAEKLGFSAQGVRAEDPSALNEIPTPSIAHVITKDGFAHFVIIEEVRNNIVTVVDPAKGRRTEKIEEFCQYWTGVLVLIEKNKYFKKGDESIKFLPMMLSVLKPNKNLIIAIFIASLFLNLFGFLGTFYFKFLVDDIVPNQLLTSLHTISLGILFMYVLQNVLTFARNHLILYFGMRTDISLMLGYYKHVLSLPMNFFETRKVGEVLSRFMDASKIRDAIASAAVTSLIDIVMIIVGSIILYIQNSTLFLITLLTIPIYISLAYAFSKPYNRYNEEQMESNAKLNSYLVESISGIQTIRAYQAEDEIFVKAESYFIKLMKKIFKLGMYTNAQSSIKGFLDLAVSLFILWIGSTYVIRGEMTLGDLLTFNALVIYFLGPIERFIELQPKIQSATIATKRLGEILELKSESEAQTGTNRYQCTVPHYPLYFVHSEMKDVSFGYGNRGNVLENINIKFYPGQHIAFVGESGSGKSTLAKLLVRFYQPDEGEIKIDSHRIEAIKDEYLRSRISYVTQDTFFFSGTILENLLYGVDFVDSMEDVVKACEYAEIHEFIEGLPQKYETVLEENGKNLSGGQLQRLSIAKALLKKPGILILDEATSALDSITEQKIIKRLKTIDFETGFKDEKPTIIMIAHRLSTIKHADQIFVLKDKKIVETGKHEELICNEGEYYELWKNQMI